MREEKKCIACAENILVEASLCKHCGTSQIPAVTNESVPWKTEKPAKQTVVVVKKKRWGCGSIFVGLLLLGIVVSAFTDSESSVSTSPSAKTSSAPAVDRKSVV